MPAIECPIHGEQLGSIFCSHAAGAINGREPMELFLQRNQYAWYTVCPACIRMPKAKHEPNRVACEKCIVEWVSRTGSDYLERCQAPVEEHPDG